MSALRDHNAARVVPYHAAGDVIRHDVPDFTLPVTQVPGDLGHVGGWGGAAVPAALTSAAPKHHAGIPPKK